MLASESADPHPRIFARLTPSRAAENAAFIKDVVSEPCQGTLRSDHVRGWWTC